MKNENISNFITELDTDYQHIYYDIFDIQYRTASDSRAISYGVPNTFFRIICVLISRLGFILIQLGCIPIENVYKIIFYNILEISNSLIAYVFAGYILSFGTHSLKGFIGYSTTYLSYDIEDIIVGFCAVLIGTAQISTFIIGRIHLVGSILVALIYSAVYQPMLMHWIWNDNGWMTTFHFLKKRVSVKDHGGALVMHLSSSIIGIVGALFLGRRIVKVEDLDCHSIGREHIGSTIIGYVFIIFGYIAFSLPTPLYEAKRIPDNYAGIILVNSIIAFATGTFITSVLHLIISRKVNYWTIIRCLQGGVAGLISVSAGVDIYLPSICFLISLGNSFIFFLLSLMIHYTAIEDYCNLISTHLICSILGSIICPCVAQKENFNYNSRVIHVLWQLICTAIVFAATSVFSCLLFLFLKFTRCLRSDREVKNHRRAVVLQKYLSRKSLLNRLFLIDSETDLVTPEDDHGKKYGETKNGERSASKKENNKAIQNTNSI